MINLVNFNNFQIANFFSFKLIFNYLVTKQLFINSYLSTQNYINKLKKINL